MAPFHDFDSKVPADVKTELDQIKADIISGKITIAVEGTAEGVLNHSALA